MYLYPILAGILFGIIGLAYRLGQERGLTTPMVVLYMTAAGVLFFGIRTGSNAFDTPMRVWILGIAAGVAQYLTIELVAAALKRGPLSPIWCALNLVFVPVIIYCWAALGESLNTLKVIGIVVAISSVVCGAIQPSGSKEGGERSKIAQYLAILVAALFCNSLLHGSIKNLKHTELMDKHGNFFFFLLYAFMGLPILVKLFIKGFGKTFSRAGIGTGALAAFGSIVGFSLLAASAGAPAAIVFTLNSIGSLMTGALISVAFFQEKITVWWILMMTLALAAVVMVSVS